MVILVHLRWLNRCRHWNPPLSRHMTVCKIRVHSTVTQSLLPASTEVLFPGSFLQHKDAVPAWRYVWTVREHHVSRSFRECFNNLLPERDLAWRCYWSLCNLIISLEAKIRTGKWHISRVGEKQNFLEMQIVQQQHTYFSQFLVKFQAFVLKDVTHTYG